MTNQNHPFHLVTPSSWPIIISLSLFNNLISAICMFYNLNYFMLLTIPCTMMCMIQWWHDVIREAIFQGCHWMKVFKGMRM